MKYVFMMMFLTNIAFGHDCNPTKPKDPCAPKKKSRVAARVVQGKPEQRQEQKANAENEQDQHQSQIVNVYPQTVQRVVVEKSYYHSADNQLGFLLGYGPNGCCDKGLIGGAGYQRRVAGPFWLGVEVFTNRSYFGRIGLDF